MQKKLQTYGLSTAIAMIVGVVIGSGIYFKVDDILNYAGGSIWLGMVIIALGSFAIVFGSLSLSELSIRNTEKGGIFSYYARYINQDIAASLGFFTAYVYLPSLIAVVTWVGANFTLGNGSSLEMQILLAAFYLIVLTTMNIFSRVLAGRFQSLSTMLKILPLLAIALVGIFWKENAPSIPQGVSLAETREVGWTWLSGLMPLYFAYDGWTVVASLAPEMKNPGKNISRAFITGPMVILVLYLLFFYGLNSILGPIFVMSTGNDAVIYATEMIYGKIISKILLVIIIISVLGVSNGLLLSLMRLPQAFAERGWTKNNKLAHINPKYQLSVPASLLVSACTLVWLLIHYFVSKFNLLPGSDISEIAIVFNNLTFVLLYVSVLKLYLKGEITNRLTGLVSPIMAILSALVLLLGSLLTNPMMAFSFMIFCSLSCLGGFVFYRYGVKK